MLFLIAKFDLLSAASSVSTKNNIHDFALKKWPKSKYLTHKKYFNCNKKKKILNLQSKIKYINLMFTLEKFS